MATKKTTKKTAAKKPAAKTTAAKKPGKAMVNWSEELAKRASSAAAIEENVGSGGTFISLKGGRMTFNGAEVPGNKMNVVVLDHILEYTFYLDGFDSDNPQPPDAYALGRDENTLRWHENSIDELDGEPIAGELCKESSINQWGSAEKGRGKAAKNQRRLALITEDEASDVESIEEASPAFLRIPVTSVKGWAGYVRQLEKTLQRPPLGVVTEISVVPDDKTQFKLQFKLVEAIEDGDVIEALMAKADATELDFPYAPREEEDEKPQRGRGGGRGRTGGGAKRPVQKAAKKAAGKRSKY